MARTTLLSMLLSLLIFSVQGHRRLSSNSQRRALANEREKEKGEANLTFYDDARGGTGIKFAAYPLEWHEKDVYPVAVHQKNFKNFAYKVIRIDMDNGRSLYGHVTDMCDRDEGSCNNAFKNGKDFLIDLHKTGWKAAGKHDGILAANYSVVGSIFPNDMPLSSLDSYVFCECKDSVCDLESALWKPRGHC